MNQRRFRNTDENRKVARKLKARFDASNSEHFLWVRVCEHTSIRPLIMCQVMDKIFTTKHRRVISSQYRAFDPIHQRSDEHYAWSVNQNKWLWIR